jgi:hypothetical protein
LFSSLSPGAATYSGKAGAKLMAAEYYGNRSMNIFIHKPETKIRSSDILYLGGVVTIAHCVYIVRESSAIPQIAGRILIQPFKELHYPTYHLLQHWRAHNYAHRMSLHIYHLSHNKHLLKFRCLSPRANYTDWATAACRRS